MILFLRPGSLMVYPSALSQMTISTAVDEFGAFRSSLVMLVSLARTLVSPTIPIISMSTD